MAEPVGRWNARVFGPWSLETRAAVEAFIDECRPDQWSDVVGFTVQPQKGGPYSFQMFCRSGNGDLGKIILLHRTWRSAEDFMDNVLRAAGTRVASGLYLGAEGHHIIWVLGQERDMVALSQSWQLAL